MPQPARPRQMVHFVALPVVSGRSPRVDRTVLPSLLIQLESLRPPLPSDV
ncbi:MAG: hypothetical protein JGK24_21105 [Microcoleus sp. PH2017_29_MFU_D_A]|nr:MULTISPECIES: hypothetical protein [unclassified Microcoleus]MCC3421069.1 hypothetical protein [Microcoleus sp. PH2017_07_MST_O_A]MCC3432115.1 hypothetical protein [Microcoleus sp. PH2017_04_SCI_O_A]MCC3511322.1 hypothetical protein [Microcoleus sp. PH2017_17_BER_D_A]MCC3424855.1 hypothetical protein [Microcoleus sp. PH2017_01_SCD_O_A]MCC3454756.1 hypothetical protein [Microcoleus sp. PH2017_08_TRC_O_A]